MPDYSMWALEFVQLPNYPDSALVYGATEGARMLPFYYIVLRSENHIALIDSGFANNEFGQGMIDSYGMVGFSAPEKIMPRVGLAPEDVQDIIVTHHHFDHAGGLGYFPNARVWIQRRDVDNWMAKYGAPPRLRWLENGLDPETAAVLAKIGGQGRLRLVEGVADVLPGVQVRPAFDTHTAGSQYVVVETSEGTPWVFPGDVAYVYDNIGGLDGKGMMIPIGLAQGSQECCVRSTDEMLTAANDDITRVIPSHEVRLWERYPSIQYDDGLHVGEIALAPGVQSRIGK